VSRFRTNTFLGCGFRENSADSNFPGPTLSREVGSFPETESTNELKPNDQPLTR
jgi:hypothetical protein